MSASYNAGSIVSSGGGSGGGQVLIADADGTVDAITAAYTPAIAALTDKLFVWIIAKGANTAVAPTFSPDGQPAHPIVKDGGQPLVAGDIPGALAVCGFEYNLANTRWELVNPATAGIVDNAVTYPKAYNGLQLAVVNTFQTMYYY